MADLNKLINDTRVQMQKSIEHLETELSKVRAGRANPSMLEGVKVDYYGSMMPLSQVSNVSVTDAHTLTIQPWEKSMLQIIEKAIRDANLGFNPQNDGMVIRINVPSLTEDRRKDLVKRAKAEAEHAKVGIRTSRKEANDECKAALKAHTPEDMVKDAEDKIQKMTDQFIATVDKHLDAKDKEIMTV